MTYTTNMPLVGQNISVTQPLIEDNFNYLNTYWAVDHVAFNALNVGAHNAIHLQSQVSSDPTTSASQIGFYSKNDANSNLRIFYREPSSGTVQQLTGAVNKTTTGFSMLPGGLIVAWGIVAPAAGSSNTTGTVTFPNFGFVSAGFPTAILNLQLSLTCSAGGTGQSNTIYAQNTTVLQTGFSYQIVRSSSTPNFYWTAIGN